MSDLSRNVVNRARALFRVLLDRRDMLSIGTAKRIAERLGFPRLPTAALIYMAANLGVLTYQYAYATWFMYLLTRVRGLSKLYRVVFRNPLLGLFFFASFYVKVLEGTRDERRFNAMASSLGLPVHADFVGQRFLTSLSMELPRRLVGGNLDPFLLSHLQQVLRTVAGIVLSQQVERLGETLRTALVGQRAAPIVVETAERGIRLESQDVLSQEELEEYGKFLERNRRKIEKRVKRRVGKNKRRVKREIQRIVEKRTEGGVRCLSGCKGRVKTSAGCYCESDCGSSFLGGGRSWCYVDPTRCKNGKYLRKHREKSWDHCDTTRTTSPLCWSGARWLQCT